jgi:small subunit ribosomal protein S20
MPIIRSAIRKQRADKRKAGVNARTRNLLKDAVRVMRRKPTKENQKKMFVALDRAARKKVIHKNKAARLKSRLSRLVKVKRS